MSLLSTQPDLDKRFKKLFQSGKLVQVHVSKWSMTVPASVTDLNVEAAEESKIQKVPEFITLGKKALFTDDVRLVFSRLESKARVHLADNSHRFPVADAHFVPQKTLIDVLTVLEQIRTTYMEAVETFITNYEAYKQQMFDEYPDYAELLKPHYPTPEAARAKFNFSVSVYEVAFPRKVAKVTAADVVAQNLAIEAATTKYEALMKEQYQHHLHQMQDFLRESALGMRAEIIKTFEVIAQKIQNREVVSTSNLKTLKNTIESFDALDFLDDTKVKSNLSAVKKLLSSGVDFKDDETALARLSVAVNTTLETAKNMTDVDLITGEYTRRLDLNGDL